MTLVSRVLATSMLAVGLLAVPGSASATPPDWTVYRSQTVGNQNFILNAVAVPANFDVWAVGYRYGTVGGALEFRTVIEHSVGGGDFQLIASPDREGAPATNFLQDVAGVSSSDMWTVGWSRLSGPYGLTLIEHWDGTAWSIVPSPSPGQFSNTLEGVSARGADDVWAVGARQDGFYETPLAEHWDGSAWTAVDVPNPDYCTGHSYLTDVTPVGPHAMWAVGWCTAASRGGEQGYIVRWNGRGWHLPSASAGIPQNSEIYGISAAGARGVWIVGYTRDGGAVALRWDGAAWVAPPSWPGAAGTSLAGVVARHPTVAWAVGAGPSAQPPFAGPAAERFVHGQTLVRAVPVSYGSLRGVTYDAADGLLWAVGTQLPGQNDIPLIVSRPIS